MPTAPDYPPKGTPVYPPKGSDASAETGKPTPPGTGKPTPPWTGKPTPPGTGKAGLSAKGAANFLDPTLGFGALPLTPPFSFSGVRTRVFPLRAKLNALQVFCDSYLNIIPPELGRFKAFSPYVSLMVLDYGKMASRAASFGWIAQKEVTFAIPLEWYRVVGDEWVFQDWAWVNPFVFVDESMSHTLGRTVYGWQKVLAKLWEGTSFENITEPGPVMSVSTSVFRKLYTGKPQKKRVFLEIMRAAQNSVTRVPPNIRNPLSPWMAMPNMLQATTNYLWDAWQSMAGAGKIPPWPEDRGPNMMEMARQVMAMASPIGSDFHFNTINLKQFRSLSDPSVYCYQALTNARMDVASFNGGGLLAGDPSIGWDASGGYSIKLHCWPSLPIVETLGLEVESIYTDQKVDVATVRPVFPFWYDVDLDYNTGGNIAWRAYDTRWRDEWGRKYEPNGPPESLREKQFNTDLGPTASPGAGPFFFPKETMRVLPLKADTAALQTFVDKFLNDPLDGFSGYRFAVWSGLASELLPADAGWLGIKGITDPLAPAPRTVVFMAASNCEDKQSERFNIGTWDERELSFLIPVVLYKNDPIKGDLIDAIGLVPAFNFNNNPSSTIIATEVSGISTAVSNFVSPEHPWMTTRGPDLRTVNDYLWVTSEQIPALGEGLKASERSVVEVGARLQDDSDQLDDAGKVAKAERRRLNHSKNLHDARMIAMATFAESLPLKLFTMKQFRDVANPDEACFQALACIRRALNSGFVMEQLPPLIEVRIHAYPTVPIVEQLGLQMQKTQAGDGAIVYTFYPSMPFWLTMPAIELEGVTLCYRAGGEEWQAGPDGPGDIDSVLPVASPAPAVSGLRALWKSWASAASTVTGSHLFYSPSPTPPGAWDAQLQAMVKTPPIAVLGAVLDLALENGGDMVTWYRRRTVWQATYEGLPGTIDDKITDVAARLPLVHVPHSRKVIFNQLKKLLRLPTPTTSYFHQLAVALDKLQNPVPPLELNFANAIWQRVIFAGRVSLVTDRAGQLNNDIWEVLALALIDPDDDTNVEINNKLSLSPNFGHILSAVRHRLENEFDVSLDDMFDLLALLDYPPPS